VFDKLTKITYLLTYLHFTTKVQTVNGVTGHHAGETGRSRLEFYYRLITSATGKYSTGNEQCKIGRLEFDRQRNNGIQNSIFVPTSVICMWLVSWKQVCKKPLVKHVSKILPTI